MVSSDTLKHTKKKFENLADAVESAYRDGVSRFHLLFHIVSLPLSMVK